jgi:hypothetical protein
MLAEKARRAREIAGMLGRHVYTVSSAPEGGWKVVKEGEEAPRGLRPTREAALSYACELAGRDAPSKVIVETADGRIEAERSFGPDPGVPAEPGS